MAEDTYKLGGYYADDFALRSHEHLGEDIITPVAEAVDADMVNGIHANQTATANQLYPLNENAKFPASIIEGKVSDSDKLDGKDSSEFAVASHQHALGDLDDVTSDEAAAFNAAGDAGASGENRLATMSDLTGSGRGWHHDGTLVVNNVVAPTSWVDIDLSSRVGHNRVLVMLKLKNRGGRKDWFLVRTNGETDEFHLWEPASGINLAAIGPSYTTILMIETDGSGVIEWKGQGVCPADIWLLGYVK